MMVAPKFKKGDRVRLASHSLYPPLLQSIRSFHGDGPFDVEEVIWDEPWEWVKVKWSDERFSGAIYAGVFDKV